MTTVLSPSPHGDAIVDEQYWQKGRVASRSPLFPRPGIKLREANQQQQFNRNVEDIELWLYEVEGHLASDDYGKDLTNVQNLQKKHALLEADVAAHQVQRARGRSEGRQGTSRPPLSAEG